MATDAETIAQLQAERAELLRRIDAAESTLSALRDAAVAEAARHATAAERARCLAAATRVGAFAACDEMLRDAPDAGETPPQAYGRGVAEGRRMAQRRDDAAPIGPPVWSHEEFTAAVEAEREECARLCDVAAALYGGDEEAGSVPVMVLRAASRKIRARGSQEPPQRPEAPRDVATPAPDAPSPARGLPVAAAGVGR